VASRLDFVRQLDKVRFIAVQLPRQAGDDLLGWHHLAVDHAQQLHRIDAQFLTQLVNVGVSGHAESANVGAEGIGWHGWIISTAKGGSDHSHGNMIEAKGLGNGTTLVIGGF
jgi:hypothetical protein